MTSTYPSKGQVVLADLNLLCRWYRFLPSPMTEEEIDIMKTIVERWQLMGGFTPEISKDIGWDNN